MLPSPPSPTSTVRFAQAQTIRSSPFDPPSPSYPPGGPIRRWIPSFGEPASRLQRSGHGDMLAASSVGKKESKREGTPGGAGERRSSVSSKRDLPRLKEEKELVSSLSTHKRMPLPSSTLSSATPPARSPSFRRTRTSLPSQTPSHQPDKTESILLPPLNSQIRRSQASRRRPRSVSSSVDASDDALPNEYLPPSISSSLTPSTVKTRPRSITLPAPPPPKAIPPLVILGSNPRAYLVESFSQRSPSSVQPSYPRYPSVHARPIDRNRSPSNRLHPTLSSQGSYPRSMSTPLVSIAPSPTSSPPQPSHTPLRISTDYPSQPASMVSPTTFHFSTLNYSSRGRKRASSTLTAGSSSRFRHAPSPSVSREREERDASELAKAKRRKDEKEEKEERRREREREKRFVLLRERERAGVGWGNGQSTGLGGLVDGSTEKELKGPVGSTDEEGLSKLPPIITHPLSQRDRR
jgi:hypothetical protein